MKKIYFAIYLLFKISDAYCQLTTFYVKPVVTNTNYAAVQDSHYVALNNTVATTNLLLVFIDGSGSKTKDYTFFPQLAANSGYHVVSIAYPNSPTVGSLCDASSDSLCFDNVRQEICYGTPVSNAVSVDTLNSIHNRLVNLLTYLSITYPTNGWGQFLSSNEVVWNKVVTSGHSQGSGHAIYFSKTQSCNRVIMFSGVDDFSTHFNKPAHWIYNTSVTPISRVYSFLHLRDDVEPYSREYQIIQALGLMTGGDDSTIVDDKNAPYNNSHCLYTNVTPPHSGITSCYHDATAVDYFSPLKNAQPLYYPVWTYMLTTPADTPISAGLIETKNNTAAFTVYPNPANAEITISLPSKNYAEIEILNMSSERIIKTTTQIKIDVSTLPNGVYLIKAKQGNNNYIQKFIKE